MPLNITLLTDSQALGRNSGIHMGQIVGRYSAKGKPNCDKGKDCNYLGPDE
jgi:hypothetical protein